MNSEESDKYNIIGFNPDEITLTTKGLVSRLIETCLKTYIQTEMFEVIDLEKIKSDLELIIKKHIVFENLDIKVDLIGEKDLYIKVFIDKISIDCHIMTNNVEIKFE